jgi:hypothetical protein
MTVATTTTITATTAAAAAESIETSPHATILALGATKTSCCSSYPTAIVSLLVFFFLLFIAKDISQKSIVLILTLAYCCLRKGNTGYTHISKLFKWLASLFSRGSLLVCLFFKSPHERLKVRSIHHPPTN